MTEKTITERKAEVWDLMQSLAQLDAQRQQLARIIEAENRAIADALNGEEA